MYYYRLCKTLLTFATIKHYKSKKILKNFTKLIIKSVGEKKQNKTPTQFKCRQQNRHMIPSINNRRNKHDRN